MWKSTSEVIQAYVNDVARLLRNNNILQREIRLTHALIAAIVKQYGGSIRVSRDAWHDAETNLEPEFKTNNGDIVITVREKTLVEKVAENVL